MTQSKSSSLFLNKNIDSYLKKGNKNNQLESLVVNDYDGSISDIQDDSDNDPDWKMDCLNYKGINST